jgi:esterase/lipase
MDIDPRLLQPTGLNSHFNNANLTFTDYIQQTQTLIANARIDITTANRDNILTANSPYNWTPANASPHKAKRGILLIHGLYDSPFSLMDLGRHLSNQGFIVRSILLPGHGTVPGDLLHIQRSEWIKAVDYGFASLQKEVEQIFIGGFSLGCTLALRKAITHPEIHGLILFAPAIKLWRSQLAYLGHLISWLSADFKWYRRSVQKSYTKYESFNFDAAYQGCKLTQETRALMQKKPVKMPLFIAQSTTDETVIADSVIDVFKQHPNPHSRLLLYTPQPATVTDPRIKQCSSYFPEKNILDFSHTCLPIAPDNYYYGAHGIYQDFAHYQHIVPTDQKIYMGSISKKNLSQHVMQRLSYNPDFDNMMREIDQFLERI